MLDLDKQRADSTNAESTQSTAPKSTDSSANKGTNSAESSKKHKEVLDLRQYMVVSFSHKRVDIATREALSFKSSEIVPFLETINASEAIFESILLCTCNRVELYVSMNDKHKATKHILSTLAKFRHLDVKMLETIALVRLNEYAIYHIFSVASSLDSLVIGETQITGQLKSAYKLAFDKGLCAKDMTRLMHFAFKCAASVRQETDISSQSVSIASTAVFMAEQKLKAIKQSIKGLEVLVIGSGEMGKLACKHLLHLGANITLISRSKAHALNVACGLDSSHIKVESWRNLPNMLDKFMLLFSATSAKHCIIKANMVSPSKMKRFWFDLALPRDIESIALKDLQIFCVDDLEEVIKEHKSVREESAKLAHKILERYTHLFFTWLQTLSVEPVIKQIRALARDSSLKELDRAVKKGYIPKEYKDNVEKILHSAFNTFLHKPTMRLREASESHSGDPLIEAAKSMFDLQDDIVMLNNYKCERDTL